MTTSIWTEPELHRHLCAYPTAEPADVVLLLAQAQSAVERTVSVEIGPELTARDVRVLLRCTRRGVAVAELRERERVTRQGMHKVVDRLVAAGLVERDWHTTTMAQTVCLTPAGADCVAVLRRAVAEWLDGMAHALRGGSVCGLLEDLQVLGDDRPLHLRPMVRDQAVHRPGGPEARLRAPG